MKRIAICLLICSCDTTPIPPPYQIGTTQDISSITGLEGCLLRQIKAPIIEQQHDKALYYSADIYIVRCPNSSTTVKYSYGKNCTRTVTVTDGGSECEPN